MTVAPTSARFNRSEWSSAFRNVDEELTNVPLKLVRGEVPDALRGSLYRNGPGRLERDGQRVHHPFDGDGMITALPVSYTHLTLPTNREV